MDIRTAPLLLALLPFSLSAAELRASAVELPARFVTTWQNEGLQGQPRRVLMQETSQRFPPQRLTEDVYSDSGLRLSHMTSSREGDYASPESYRLHIDKGRLRQVMYAPAHFGNGFMGGSVTVRQFDSEGRIAVLAGHPPLTPLPQPAAGEVPGAGRDDVVTHIRYEADRQTQDVFLGPVFAHRLVFEFNGDTLWRSSCVEGHCDSATLEEYGEHGLLRRITAGTESQWYYENGVPAAMVTQNASTGALIERVHFENYRFDDCGNWIYREHYSAAPFTPGRHKTGSSQRKIDYFAPCTPRPAP